MLIRRVLLVAALASLPLTGAAPRLGAAEVTKIPAAEPCGVAGSATYSHVVWIMLENVGYSIVGSSDAPYLNELTDRCGLATNYYAVSHPSLPNYIALTSGSTQGITDDGEPSEHPLKSQSIFAELDGNWRTLAQSMPRDCDRVTSGAYAARHNPAVYYTDISAQCRGNDVPLSYPLNLSAKFTIIVPNICDDMHSCPASVGDNWLSNVVPAIVRSSLYQSRSMVVFITFDENDSDASNQVPTVVIAPSVHSGARDGTKFTHYSLLRTTEQLLHLSPLGDARSAASMIRGFNL